MKRFQVMLVIVTLSLFVLMVFAPPALAHPPGHDQPDGADWLMADWMLYSFLIFFVASFTAFLVALKRGMFQNLEDAKYYVLSIDEQDYYTPDWAKKED